MSEENKTRRSINKGQLTVLGLLYKFRFATTVLIARSQGKNNGTTIHSRLAILQAQDYVGRNFDKSYRLRGKFATYFLLPKGLQALKARAADGVDPKVIKAIYNDKKASEQFIDHCLAIFGVSCDLQTMYGDAIQLFTKSDLVEYDYFPQPLPDAYISLKVGTKTKHFFLDVYEKTTPFFVMMRKIKHYIAYEESGEWDVTESNFPIILAVCDSPALQKRLQKRINGLLDSENSDIIFRTITLEALSPASEQSINVLA